MQCSHCHHERLVKNGFNRNRTQRFQCKACGRYTTLDTRGRPMPHNALRDAL